MFYHLSLVVDWLLKLAFVNANTIQVTQYFKHNLKLVDSTYFWGMLLFCRNIFQCYYCKGV